MSNVDFHVISKDRFRVMIEFQSPYALWVSSESSRHVRLVHEITRRVLVAFVSMVRGRLADAPTIERPLEVARVIAHISHSDRTR